MIFFFQLYHLERQSRARLLDQNEDLGYILRLFLKVVSRLYKFLLCSKNFQFSTNPKIENGFFFDLWWWCSRDEVNLYAKDEQGIILWLFHLPPVILYAPFILQHSPPQPQSMAALHPLGKMVVMPACRTGIGGTGAAGIRFTSLQNSENGSSDCSGDWLW